MNLRHRFLVLLACAALLSLARTAPAQTASPSHRQVNGTEFDPATAEARLAQRLGHAQEAKDFDKAIEQLAKSIKLDDLSEADRERLLKLAEQQLKDHPNDIKPLDLKEKDLAKLLENNPDFKKQLEKTKLSPEDLKALEKVVKQQEKGKDINWDDPEIGKAMKKVFEGKKEDLKKELGPGEQKALDDYLKQFGPNAKKETGALDPGIQGPNPPPFKPGGTLPPKPPQPPRPPSDHPPGNPPPPNQGAPSKPDAFKGPGSSTSSEPPDWFKKIAGKGVTMLGDDHTKEAYNKYVNLGEQAKKSGDSASAPSVGGGKAPDVGKYVPTGTMDNVGSFFGKFSMPSLPNLGGIAGPTPKMPDVGGASSGGGGGMEGLLNVVIVALIVVGIGLVIAKLVASRNAAAGTGDITDLGAWPVQPGAVRTRADLVKCFEYLAVLLLGARARTRHHLELAAEIGKQAPPVADARQTEAAQTLGRLYEIARYTPENEELQPDDLAAARRELSYLAGAAPA